MMKKIILFLCSYAPLLVIIIINFITFSEISVSSIKISPLWQIVSLSIIIILLTGLFSYKFLIKNTLSVNSTERTIKTIQLIGDKSLTNYLLSTLLPIIGISMGTDVEKVTMIIVLILLFLIFVQSNNFFFNPFLFALGYRMYQVEVGEGGITKNVIVLFNGELNDFDINLEYNFYPITNSVYLMKNIE